MAAVVAPRSVSLITEKFIAGIIPMMTTFDIPLFMKITDTPTVFTASTEDEISKDRKHQAKTKAVIRDIVKFADKLDDQDDDVDMEDIAL